MHHPCIASLQLVNAKHDTNSGLKHGTWVHAAFEHADTSLQKIVYATLDRTSHTITGRALPPLMLRSFMYQLLSALAYSHARGVAHGNLAPYRVLARELDVENDQYLLKLADFGFSPPAAALCNEELPIRPSRASPELHSDNQRKRYGPANDLWALGTVFAEAACGNREPAVYMMIQELESVDDEQMENSLHMLCDDGRDLMRQLMRAEPTVRITAADALCHPYFDGIHEQCAVVGKYLPPSRPPPCKFLALCAHKVWVPGLDFLVEQTELNSRMWSILMDWLAVVSHKFKFVPRSLQLAVDFMRRFMAATRVSRKRLQLVGIGALCLACKHEEVMIPNMNDFIFICDNAYNLEELMLVEVEILNHLQMQLHVPTVHDHLNQMLIELGSVPEHPDGEDPSKLVKWCEVLTLMGLAQHSVAIFDSAVLARCVGTLCGLLSHGVASQVTRADGTSSAGKISSKLSERVCYLSSAEDWSCLKELVKAIETCMSENREVILKCHPEYAALKPVQQLLDEYVHDSSRRANHLKARDVKQWAEKHYSIEHTRSNNLFAEFEDTSNKFLPKKAYMRGITTGDLPTFCIPAVTAALGHQLLAERRSYSNSVAS